MSQQKKTTKIDVVTFTCLEYEIFYTVLRYISSAYVLFLGYCFSILYNIWPKIHMNFPNWFLAITQSQAGFLLFLLWRGIGFRFIISF